MKKWFPLVTAALLSGFLIGFTMIATEVVPHVHIAIFFCFIPLWISWLRAASGKQIFLSGWIAQFVFALVGFNWISHAVREFGHLPWVASLLVLVLFCALANLHIPLAGLAWHYLFPRQKYSISTRIIALAFTTALFERFFPMIFEWHLGYAWFYKQWPGMHFADVVGFSGLSSLTILVNGLLLLAWRLRGGQWWWAACSALGLVLAVNIAGVWRQSLLIVPDKKISILVVQANIGNKLKHLSEHGPNYREAITEKFLSLTNAGLKQSSSRPDLVLWPETSFPDSIAESPPASGAAKDLDNFLRDKKINLMVGAFGSDSEGKDTNSLYFLSDRGGFFAPPYNKHLLLAFGEYIPGSESFPKLKQWIPQVRDFGRGPGPSAISFGDLKIGPQICYEGLFDWFSRALAVAGAEVIINITNDSWYGDWQQPYQHFYMTMAKAVEVRRPLVRSTNTGISSAVLASGKILERSPLQEEWAHTFDLPYVSAPVLSPYTRYGFWILPAIFLSMIVALWIFPRKNIE